MQMLLNNIHRIIYGIIASCVLTLVACNSKQGAVTDLLTLRAEVKEHCAEYTEAEWKNAFNRFLDICEKLDEMSFTEEERMEINKIKGEIAGYTATVAAQEITDEIGNIAAEIESFSKGFDNTFQEPKIKNEHDW